MPVKPTYPGVYVQEVDSGSRVVTGVPTSITAVVGRTIKGPANTPVTCFNYGDFERMFGGLAIDMPVPYAVQDFFDNGGSQALIVRVCAGPALEAAASLALPGTDPAFTLTARVKGEIGNQIYLSITHHVAAPDPDASQRIRTDRRRSTLRSRWENPRPRRRVARGRSRLQNRIRPRTTQAWRRRRSRRG